MIDRTDGNIVRCEKCGRMLIAEEARTHKCDEKRLTEVKQIPIQYYFQMKSNDGNPVIYARTFNDVVLWLEVVPTGSTKRDFTGYGTKQGLDSPKRCMSCST